MSRDRKRKPLDGIFVEDLPELLQEISQLIGIPATLLLVEHFGGIHLFIPTHFSDQRAFVAVVGHRAASLLIQQYGGNTLYIARAASALRALRNMEIAGRFEGGLSAERLAREYGVSVRQIWNILKRPETVRRRETTPRQPSLFD
ncbi:Mor transcription activator family protein [Alloalcanivorax xenomutans]|uniref:Mor transcription activator family protein n=1 Tax=Alloalcanivorax xenomutans TaxID=1094342 RepID=UPI003C4B8EB9